MIQNLFKLKKIIVSCLCVSICSLFLLSCNNCSPTNIPISTESSQNSPASVPENLAASLPVDNHSEIPSYENDKFDTKPRSETDNDNVDSYELDVSNHFVWNNKHGVRSADGGTSVSKIFRVSDYLDIHSYDYLDITLPVFTDKSSYGLAVYNENKKFLKGVRMTYNADLLSLEVKHIKIPEDGYYLRTTWFGDDVYSDEPFTCIAIKIGQEEREKGYIRPYLKEEAEKTIAEIKAAKNEPNISFWWFTDAHYRSNNYLLTGDSLFDMVDAIKYMDKSVSLDFILNTGDFFDGNLSREQLSEQINAINKKLLETGKNIITAIGNHDIHYSYASNEDTFDYNSQYNYYLTTMSHCSGYNDKTNKTDYYLDFDKFNLRMVVINSNNDTGGEYKFNKPETNEWLRNTALSTPDDYSILFISHLAPLKRHNPANSPYGGKAFSDLLEGYETDSKKIVGQLYGHSHMDNTFAEPYLAVSSGCQKFNQSDGGSNQGWDYPARSLYTASEQLFNAVILKPQSKVMDVIRFGAGYDRKLHYDLITIKVGKDIVLKSSINATRWDSMDESIAVVADGKISAVAEGMTGIRAYDAEGNYEMWRIKVS